MKKSLVLLLSIFIYSCCDCPVNENKEQVNFTLPKVTIPDPTDPNNWRIIYEEDYWDTNLNIFRDIYSNQLATRVVGEDTIWVRKYVDIGIGIRKNGKIEGAREDQKLLIQNLIKELNPKVVK